jgi:hypothetical protein
MRRGEFLNLHYDNFVIGNFLGSTVELEPLSSSEEPFPPLDVADILGVIIILK